MEDLKENSMCVSLDYEKEYARVSYQLEETKKELEEDKKALLRLCLKL